MVSGVGYCGLVCFFLILCLWFIRFFILCRSMFVLYKAEETVADPPKVWSSVSVSFQVFLFFMVLVKQQRFGSLGSVAGGFCLMLFLLVLVGFFFAFFVLGLASAFGWVRVG